MLFCLSWCSNIDNNKMMNLPKLHVLIAIVVLIEILHFRTGKCGREWFIAVIVGVCLCVREKQTRLEMTSVVRIFQVLETVTSHFNVESVLWFCTVQINPDRCLVSCYTIRQKGTL